MLVTGTGHAGLRIDTTAGSILCDPWVNPAYFASWFPFPDNSCLDWDQLGQVDYLYLSHLHQDHFDPELLRRHVAKDATVLLPEFPTSELEDGLRAAGFTRFVPTRSNEPVDLGGGLTVMIQALTSPTDGPIGDSLLWVEHGGVRLLNQNDARPPDFDVFKRLGPVDAHLLQFSGAIWYPMAYELSPATKQALGRRKRSRQVDRTLRYVDDLAARWVFPIAGPPCFLDDDLWHLNDLDDDPANIFMDQRTFLSAYEREGYGNGFLLLPGSIAEVTGAACTVSHATADAESVFDHKAEYLSAYRQRQRPFIEAERDSWHHARCDVLAELKPRFERLMAISTYLVPRIGAPVGLDLVGRDGTPDESLVLDFPAGEVRHYGGEDVCYRLTVPRDLVERLVRTGEVDWVNSLLLSCRFSARRVGQYNEYLFTFLKCLSDERLLYADAWCAAQKSGVEDIVLGDWVVQRRCPHLNADLARFADVEGDVLTCQLHGWQFDLRSGKCLTSADYAIRACPAPGEVPGPDGHGAGRYGPGRYDGDDGPLFDVPASRVAGTPVSQAAGPLGARATGVHGPDAPITD